MKRLLIPTLTIYLLVLTSCDKVEHPIPIEEGTVDWTLFPGGDPATYTYPIWTTNTNTDRNVLIEDYTGQLCTNCPAAADVASTLETNNPGRVFVASIHASPSGTFQSLFPPEFTIDFTTPAGTSYSSDMAGFVGNPMGTINRTNDGYQPGVVWQLTSEWSNKTNALLQTDLLANLQLEYNYFESTNGLFIHTETELLSDLDGSFNLVMYLVRDTVIAPQKLLNGVTEEEYHHHSVLSDNINGTWGTQIINGKVATGEKLYNDFSYEVPTTDSTFNIDNLSLITYLCDRESFEILQVIKTKLQ